MPGIKENLTVKGMGLCRNLTIFKFIKKIVNNLSKKHITMTVFIDIIKTFDTHNILIAELSKLDITIIISNWFKNSLTDQ